MVHIADPITGRETAFPPSQHKQGAALTTKIVKAKHTDDVFVEVTSSNVDAVKVNLYRMDLEVLFSRKPFSVLSQQDTGAGADDEKDSDFAFVNPVYSTRLNVIGARGGSSPTRPTNGGGQAKVALALAPSTTQYTIPKKFSNMDLTIEVANANVKSPLSVFKTHFASSLVITVAENNGILSVAVPVGAKLRPAH